MANGAASKEEHQQLIYETAVYREQLNLLQREIDRIALATLDLSNAAKTTEKLADGDSLIPIGGGAFVKANVSASKVLVPIGGGYLAEMDAHLAEEELKKRVDSTEKAVEKLGAEFQNLAKKLQEANAKLRDVQAQVALNKRVDDNIGEDYL